MTRRLALCLTVAALSTVPACGRAQPRPSELGGVWQTIDGAVLTLEYSRPRARGRALFGNPRVVAWNSTWTPGANWATTLDVSRDVTVQGRRLAKGKYSMWLVVRDGGPWTLVLDPRPRIFHTRPPDSTAAQLRVPVAPLTGPFTEVLTWSFADIRDDGATLSLQWGTTLLPLDVGTRP